MKILNKLAVLAIASAIILVGCQNNFSGTTLDTSSLAEAYSGNRTINKFSVAASAALVKDTNQVVSLTFTNGTVDKDSIKTAVTIYNLTAGSDNNSVHGHGTAIPYTVSAVDSNVAYLTMSLAGASDVIEVFVDSTKLTARNGATKMDLDGDNAQGEANDDDYYKEFPVAGGSLTGVARDPRLPASTLFTFTGFSMVGTPNPATLATYDTYRVTYNYATADSTDYKDLFGSCLVIEKYVASSNSWVAITTTNSYSTATGVFTASFAALTDGEVVRAKIVNVQNLKTSKEVAGFVQRYTMNNLDVTADVVTGPFAARDSATTLSTVNQSDLLTGNIKVNADSSNLNVNLVIDFSSETGITGNQGITGSTATTDNIKLYDTTAKAFIPVTVSARAKPDSGNTVVNQIVLTLDPSYMKVNHSHTLYLGPGLKTAGDATPGVNACKFGDPTNINVTSSICGFYDFALTTTF